MSVNDKMNQIFDHDGTIERNVTDSDTDEVLFYKDNGLTKNVKDCLNSMQARDKGNLNDAIFKFFGRYQSDTNDGQVLTLNDRMKAYFYGKNINDGLNTYGQVIGGQIPDSYIPELDGDIEILDSDYNNHLVFGFTTNRGGVFYSVLLDHDSTAPTPTQIKEGKNGDGNVQGSNRIVYGYVAPNKQSTAYFESLSPETEYDFYLTFEDFNFPPNLSDVVYSATTETGNESWSNTELGLVNGCYAWFYRYPSSNTFYVTAQTPSNQYPMGGTLFAIAVDHDTAHIPTPSEVKQGVNYGAGGSLVEIRGSGSHYLSHNNSAVRQLGWQVEIGGLSPNTQYDIYVAPQIRSVLSENVYRINNVSTRASDPFNAYSLVIGNPNGFAPDILDDLDELASDAWTFSGWFKYFNPERFHVMNRHKNFLTYGVFGYNSGDYGFNSKDMSSDGRSNLHIYFDTREGDFNDDGSPVEADWYCVTTMRGVNGDEETKMTKCLKVATDYDFPYDDWINLQVKHNTTGRVDVFLNFKDKSTGNHVKTIIHTHQASSSIYYVSPTSPNKQITIGHNKGFGLDNESDVWRGHGHWFNERTLVNECCVWHGNLSAQQMDYIYNNGLPFDLTNNNGDSTGNYNSANDIHKYLTGNQVNQDLVSRNGRSHIFVDGSNDRGIGDFIMGMPLSIFDDNYIYDSFGILRGDTPNLPIDNIFTNFAGYNNDRVYPAELRQPNTQHSGGTE